jgi:cation diffusion facilitator CzcD-associated flavoprotein CzcO
VTSDGQGSSYDVVVIGASQAGLAMGYHLAQKGLSFVILDAGPEIGHLWRSRWDSRIPNRVLVKSPPPYPFTQYGISAGSGQEPSSNDPRCSLEPQLGSSLEAMTQSAKRAPVPRSGVAVPRNRFEYGSKQFWLGRFHPV